MNKVFFITLFFIYQTDFCFGFDIFFLFDCFLYFYIIFDFLCMRITIFVFHPVYEFPVISDLFFINIFFFLSNRRNLSRCFIFRRNNIDFLFWVGSSIDNFSNEIQFFHLRFDHWGFLFGIFLFYLLNDFFADDLDVFFIL